MQAVVVAEQAQLVAMARIHLEVETVDLVQIHQLLEHQ
jgi:hypothetical protein